MWRFYQQYQRLSEVLFWIFLSGVNASINAVSVIADYERWNQVIASWEPWSWEISSQIMLLALIPLIVVFNRRFPIRPEKLFSSMLPHLVFSVAFSLLHVAGMVGIRNVVYMYMSRTYEFGNWPVELFYEYRKDVLNYFTILAIIYIYRFIVSRLSGEAHVIATGEDTPEPEYPERLLIKKLGKEFIIRIIDIEWIEAAGNYMNLHVGSRIYPLRDTMAGLEEKLDRRQFARIHRSQIVNLDRISEISPLESGDCTVLMKSGQELRLSRRYRESIRELLSF